MLRWFNSAMENVFMQYSSIDQLLYVGTAYSLIQQLWIWLEPLLSQSSAKPQLGCADIVIFNRHPATLQTSWNSAYQP